jgi:hypothetical protein
MKIRELIKQATELEAEHGDLNVYLPGMKGTRAIEFDMYKDTDGDTPFYLIRSDTS